MLGDATGVTGVRLKDTQTGATEDLSLQGCFIAIGHQPNTEIFQGQLEMKNGYITLAAAWKASPHDHVPGVYAAGDVQDTCTARRSPAPGPGAWRRWTRSASSNSRVTPRGPRAIASWGTGAAGGGEAGSSAESRGQAIIAGRLSTGLGRPSADMVTATLSGR